MIILQDEHKSTKSILSHDDSQDDYEPEKLSDSGEEYEYSETSTGKRKVVQSKKGNRRGRGDTAFRRSLMQRSGLSRSQMKSSTSTAAQSASYRVKDRVGRPRGSARTKRVLRAELLSQHEIIVDELLEEDAIRGSQLDSPRETIKLEGACLLSEGKFLDKS